MRPDIKISAHLIIINPQRGAINYSRLSSPLPRGAHMLLRVRECARITAVFPPNATKRRERKATRARPGLSETELTLAGGNLSAPPPQRKRRQPPPPRVPGALLHETPTRGALRRSR
ncbi:hypothetical protein SKAU_G00379180 [Synaphobranchus kaupii]|uniref:Uncharacterized protein n=1 Tax=Synaphobranchus kaupii TaxID=118154 RepID=A0A9Q1EDC9_SYNKA|nr:hypothetical protein SKAU_G00379180 [Synaphobranchus kaupii]